MKKLTTLLAALLLLPALAWAGAEFTPSTAETATFEGNKTISGDFHVTGSADFDGTANFDGVATLKNGAVIGETLGPELAPTTCAGYTYSAPWTCSDSPLTFTRTASATAPSVSITTTSVVGGTTYKFSWTNTTTAGNVLVVAGGTSSATRSTSASFVDYLAAGSTQTTGVNGVAVTAGATYAGVITNISVKAVTSTLASSSGPLKIEKTFANATANESALAVSGNQTGAAGDKSLLMLDYIGSGSGTEYGIMLRNAGTQAFSLTAAGAVVAATSITGLTINSSHTAPGATGSIFSNATLTNAPNSVFSYGGTPAAHNNASNTTTIFDDSAVLSAAHSAGPYISFRANDKHANGAPLNPEAFHAGTGYAYEFVGPGYFTKSFVKTPLTNNSATDLFTITLAAGEVMNGRFDYGITATGGTNDLQAHSGAVTFACANKGGTFTKDIDEVYLAASETQIVTAGTLSDTWAMKAGDVCTVTLNINSSLGSAVDTVRGVITIYSNKTITLN